MDVNTKFGHYLENFGNPCMVCCLITNKTFYINKQATELFGITTDDCDLGKVFQKSPERIQSLMGKALNQSKPTLVYNYTAYDRVIPDYGNTFFHKDTIHPDDKEIYLKGFRDFHEKVMPCEEPIRFTLGGAPYKWYKITAKKIFDKEGNLTAVFGTLVNVDNEVNMRNKVSTLCQYYDVLNEITGESLFIYDIKTDELRLGSSTEKELRLPTVVKNSPDSVMEWVHPDDLEIFKNFDGRALESDKNTLEVRLKNVDRKYQWYELLSDIIYDDEGNKKGIFGRIKNIQSKHKLESEIAEANQELSVMSQYFSAMQTLSGESLYTINTETKVMSIEGDIAQELGLKPVHTDYPDCVISCLHPDDVQSYKNFSSKTWSGLDNEVKLRARKIDGTYHWYKLTSRIIRDDIGKAIEILGIIRNIHVEETMQSEVSTLNQYVEAVQSLSGESLYYVDVKTRILRQKGEVAVELGLPEEVPNYPEGAYPVVHPNHLENFKVFAQNTLNGKASSIQCQVQTATGEYQWCEIISMHIYDKTGAIVEIFGRMTNIEKEMTIKSEYSVLNQYFTAMQNLSQNILFHIDVKTKTFKHALVFIDLDDFKGVNDKLGYSYGDELLTTVGKRLKRHVREGDLVGRIGGDEFAMLLCNIGDEQSVFDRANIMLESVKRNFCHEGILIGIKPVWGWLFILSMVQRVKT